MPKYIFKKNEYTKFVHEKYRDLVLEEYTGRKYNQTKIRWFHMPGEMLEAKKYGYSLGINIGVNSFAPGGVYEAHKHKSPAFYYVISGRARVRVGDEERVVGPGTWVVTPPHTPHSVVNIGKKPFTYITAETFHNE
jgi:mannose-6-phosphate isomerase-like protein (cupin superfamily)